MLNFSSSNSRKCNNFCNNITESNKRNIIRSINKGIGTASARRTNNLNRSSKSKFVTAATTATTTTAASETVEINCIAFATVTGINYSNVKQQSQQ